VRADGEVWRQGLNVNARTRGEDTVRVVSVLEAGKLTREEGICTYLRVVDDDGNTTLPAELPALPRPAPIY
jgi:hypothetical protein